MSSVQLATLSTGLWVVATVSLFIVLARWSEGDSWGLTASIVRGVRGWADRDRPVSTVSSPFVERPPSLLVPGRPIGGVNAARLAAGPALADAAPRGVDRQPSVEVVDLGERRLGR